MNFIPEKAEPNGNYLCTWGLQASAAKKLGIKGDGCADQRDALNTERVEISQNTITLDGKDIRHFGKDKLVYNEDLDPSLLIKII